MGDLSQTRPFWGTLPERFVDFLESERWLPLLQRHHEVLMEAAPRVSTTSVAAEDAPQRLYGESLETLRIILSRVDKPDPVVVDVGSGGGFPGLVFAAVMPRWRLTLVEPMQKRGALLGAMAEKLGMENVTVLATRAEDAGRGPLRDSADVVTARAVAELRELVEYTAPFTRPGGLIALPKGSRLPEELAAAQRALDELRVIVLEKAACRPEVSATPWTLLLRKEGATPERYPRRAGVPHKRPL